ncbi:hypothetical protein ES703_99196 [subsurface metagenome]
MRSSRLRWAKRALIYFAAAFGYRRPIFNLAKKAARITGKPLLNAGCGSAYVESSDVNLDIVPRTVPNFVRGDIQNLSMFQSKQFGAAYASHVLEHVEGTEGALQELNRVAENVFIVTPFPLWPSAWLCPSHKWVLWKGKRIARVPQFLRKGVNSMKCCGRGVSCE